MHKKTLYLTSVCCLLFLSVDNLKADDETVDSSPTIYNLPDDATCKNNYCVDTENNPITGTIRRYKNGYLIRDYVAQDGYLEGISHTYYKNGNTKTERSYKRGVLDGTVIEYDKEGQMVENITYKNGKKEGIASYYDEDNITKVIYIDNNINGDAQIWDRKQGKLIYKFKMQNNKIISGSYTHATDQTLQEAQEDDLNQLVMEGNNQQCLQLQNIFSESSCQADLEHTISVLSSKEILSEDCNKDWYKQHKTEIIKYIKLCKCNDLKNKIKVIYEDAERDSTEKKELLLPLKEKYENHCMEKKE